MPVVTANQICRSFGALRLLVDVSVTLHRGERVGVVGKNGAGKSTLARILAGLDVPDSGAVTRRRDAQILYLEQSPRLEAGRTACEIALSGLVEWCGARQRYENAGQRLSSTDPALLLAATDDQARAAEDLERAGGWDRVHHAEAILGRLGIAEPDREAARMSGGEQRRVALARLLIARPDLAILDEPTNHLDIDTVSWLERHLIEDFEGAVLLITHDRYLLDRVAQRTLEVGRGVVTAYDGGYETYLQARAERAAHEERSERNRRNFLRTELEWLRRQPKARTGKSKARIQRIAASAGEERIEADSVAQIAAAEVRTGKTILGLEGVSLAFADRLLVAGLNLHVTQGERIGVVGPNGCGKTTLLRCLLGEIEPSAGTIARGANTRIVYLDQARSTLDDQATVFENVIGDLAVLRVGASEISPRAYLERFLFADSEQRALVGTLSGGERARVALAALLARPANLIILDEPSNDLDIATLAALEDFLLEFGGTTIVVTHDRFFLDRVATSILAFEAEGRVTRFHGSYSSYLERRAAVEAVARTPQEPAAPAAKKRSAPRVKLSYREQRELDALPDQIDAQETQIALIEKRLADPTTYTAQGREVAGIAEELERLRADTEKLIARWEELETRRS